MYSHKTNNEQRELSERETKLRFSGSRDRLKGREKKGRKKGSKGKRKKERRMIAPRGMIIASRDTNRNA